MASCTTLLSQDTRRPRPPLAGHRLALTLSGWPWTGLQRPLSSRQRAEAAWDRAFAQSSGPLSAWPCATSGVATGRTQKIMRHVTSITPLQTSLRYLVSQSGARGWLQHRGRGRVRAATTPRPWRVAWTSVSRGSTRPWGQPTACRGLELSAVRVGMDKQRAPLTCGQGVLHPCQPGAVRVWPLRSGDVPGKHAPCLRGPPGTCSRTRRGRCTTRWCVLMT